MKPFSVRVSSVSAFPFSVGRLSPVSRTPSSRQSRTVKPKLVRTALLTATPVSYTHLDVYKRQAFDGVTYDKTKYTVTVTLEDDGQGHLTPNAKISGGEDGSIVLKNELARRDLTISKTTAGNAVLSDDAFTVKIRLSRNDIVPVDGDYPMMDGAAETKLTVKNGEATLKIRNEMCIRDRSSRAN